MIRKSDGKRIDDLISSEEIVSLVPSQTELLFDLVLTMRYAALQNFVSVARETKAIEKSGALKFNLEKIIALT